VYGAIAIVKRVEESDADMVKLELADLGVHRNDLDQMVLGAAQA
jgi:hypothetical protein